MSDQPYGPADEIHGTPSTPQQPPALPQQGYAPQEPTQPQQGVVFDLDRVQAEKRRTREREIRFTTRIGGRVITFANPKGLDWQDLLYLGDDPAEFVELCIPDEAEKAHVMAAQIDSDVMEDLIEAFTRHYGVGKGRGRGNRDASRR